MDCKPLILAVALAAAAALPPSSRAEAAPPGPAGCTPDGGLSFICGPAAPEDIVLAPGGRWVVSAGLARDGAPGGLYLIDPRSKAWRRAYPDAAAPVAREARRYPACAAPPGPGFSAHGLAIRGTGAGQAILHVVGHGPRETVEVFTLDTRGAEPKLAWIGCVPMPTGLAANSIAVFSDGTILATVLYRNGTTPVDSFAGRPTGVVLQWRPGQDGFTPLEGTALPSNNGIELSADEQTFYVVSTGLKQLVEYSAKDPSKPLRRAQVVGFTPDNVRRAADGSLLLGGMIDDQPECGGKPAPVNGRMIFTCHRGYKVSVVDPATMTVRDVAQGPRNPSFSGTTTALHVGDELWLASLMGDRIAYRPWP